MKKRNSKSTKEAIEKELKRGGQVYYLHNRIGTIGMIKKALQKLVPKAKIGVIHGRLKEKELIRVMDEFQKKNYDVLVATTIIENGINLPNVNTFIVEDATKLGLEQTYQIRWRIVRSNTESLAYFLHVTKLTDKAALRLNALQSLRML